MFYNLDDYEEKLFQDLPHGSGINAEWHVKRTDKYYRCSNSFQVMDEHGFYVGWADFSLLIPIHKDPLDFKLMFHGPYSRRLANKYMLREYLEDTFAWWIDDHRKQLESLSKYYNPKKEVKNG